MPEYAGNAGWKRLLITLLRVAIGWHFLYAGAAKLMADNWSASGFLSQAAGPLAGFYHWLASSEPLLRAVDTVNVAALILIGTGLFLGLAVRLSAVSGIILLVLYYLAYPPLGGYAAGGMEGEVLVVNKNLIEALALAALLLAKDKGYGLHALRFRALSFSGRDASPAAPEGPRAAPLDVSRRETLKNLATLPALGIFGWGALRELKAHGADGLSGATIQVGESSLSELKGELPRGKLGNHVLSKLVLGGNLIGGWAHARDLIYVPSLFRAYNTENKIFETLMLAEKAGIDSINIGFASNAILRKYKKVTGSTIQVISQVHPDMKHNDYYVNINKAIDFGVDILQVQGNWCDWLVRDKKIDVVGKMLDRIRSQGYFAGLAAHTVDSLIACEEEGIVPDYYMKTMHHDRYWSAHPRENRVAFEVDGKQYLDHNRFHNNLFCLFPEKTIEFVKRATVPVMGYKILAAGAIKPEDGFRWAFKNGADFICVGMFDFQIVNDVNIAIDTLRNLKDRDRKWYG